MTNTKEEKLTPGQEIERLKLKSNYIEGEIHSARSANEEAIVESARSRSRLRKLGEKLQEQTRNLDDEIRILEKEVENSNQEQAILNKQIDTAKANLEATISKYAQQLQQKRTEHAEQESLLKSELLMYQTELESLREFQSQRAQMEEKLRQLDQNLVDQRQLHQEKMEQLNQQLSREKKQFEEENKRRVKAAEQAAVHMKDECLEAAAIRCIQDSQQVTEQLKKNQLKSKDILNSNTELIKKIDDIKRENILIEERKKMLEKDVAGYKKKMEGLKQQIADNEVSYAKQRAEIETVSAQTIEKLTKQCEDIEKENASMQKRLDFLVERTTSVEQQKKLSSSDMNSIMKLITSTGPIVLDALKAHPPEGEQPSALQALINKLTEAVEEDEKKA
ncbi:hypothetical protein TVAG_078720 [Trichomonas vaginalis G3]|uniref:Cilia- and flagella-associated protein 157 n=1 Tax=Trichomonas vaginalis (strain ATCC PRA-98 / G3) TaxID=412133 RepID=A2G6S1_TRIV3|nr:cilia- and flagella-associated protein 157 family [Trichomonas vaginalis G3]EAX87147.1 hypothetical protein TVAG_078720 [Trichomonas vaginalis G3]KAI5546963.1 cilia- and flagella-associated protein 157 family [Trichomonas vaginalis G3]|eukprot:XP_001300077.1 hypothetical protein [Trichomonas vaginalis G3]